MHFTFKLKENHLLVTTAGTVTTHEEMQLYVAAILGIRVANVVKQEGYSIAITYENALFNRSLNCKTFIEKEQAIQWLTS